MQREDFIPAETFCTWHNIDVAFITSLQDAGLISITTIEDRRFLPYDQLSTIERFIRMHYELDINTEGLEAIEHMLLRMKSMQKEIAELKARLRIYESSLSS